MCSRGFWVFVWFFVSGICGVLFSQNLKTLKEKTRIPKILFDFWFCCFVLMLKYIETFLNHREVQSHNICNVYIYIPSCV